MANITEQYLECARLWRQYKIYADCSDGSSNMTYLWYNEKLETMPVNNNTIFTITYDTGESYTSIGLEALDKYIRENCYRKNVASVTTVGGYQWKNIE